MSKFNTILKKLVEAPQNHIPLDSDVLTKDSQEYYDKNKSKFKPTDTKYLLKSGNDIKGYYMLVVNDVVEYFVNYDATKFKNMFDHKFARQVLVHRNSYSPKSAGIPKTVFFDYLLPTFGGIVSDDQQTDKGRQFWTNAIIDALKQPNKYDVYIIKKSSNELIPVETFDEFDSKGSEIWGNEISFKFVLLAIVQK